ncbi:Uncharacterised protein [Urinicoccus massiliensis]|uniref:Uncharacterized protein n=1 Tax=Urinicoccus massiliensis TaxID=1723382 RepID=A0A8H2M7E1_9FIRM|nr:Uncharacterised protein [Urinicoccus massiliensis]
MKGKRLFINSLIILVAIFFAYKTLSYLRLSPREALREVEVPSVFNCWNKGWLQCCGIHY